jgi:hypothetical protein
VTIPTRRSLPSQSSVPAKSEAVTRAANENKPVDLAKNALSSSPELPNERDEKVDMTGGVQSSRVQQGARDLRRGVKDTSRSVEADETYKNLKR